jgi:hypothetical protein
MTAMFDHAAIPAHDEPRRDGSGGPVCFVFLDGIGLGPPNDSNPLATAPMPGLRELLGGPLVSGSHLARDNLLLLPLDAGLGVSGLPQSATGQTALFTGVNAAAQVGSHVPAYPTRALQKIISERSLLRQVTDNGLKATFANAYSDSYWQRVAQGKLRHSASTLTTMAAQLSFRTLGDLRRGEAVYWDITHDVMRLILGLDIEQVRPEEAGRRLAGLMASHDLVLFESFLTDLAGHRRLPWPTEAVLALLDRFLQALVASLPGDATLVLSSDHGNLEDSSTRSHTLNPVPLLVVGPGAATFHDARAITDVAPAIVRWLGDQNTG